MGDRLTRKERHRNQRTGFVFSKLRFSFYHLFQKEKGHQGTQDEHVSIRKGSFFLFVFSLTNELLKKKKVWPNVCAQWGHSLPPLNDGSTCSPAQVAEVRWK